MKYVFKHLFLVAPLAVALLVGACSSSSDSTLNFPPSADAGPDQTVNENTQVQLAGKASDLDDVVTIASWSQISGPSVTIASPNSLAATFLAPQVAIGSTETIVLRLTVTDPRGAAAVDEVTISVDSADFVLFRANKDDLAATELYKYDTQAGTVTKLSGTLIAGRDVGQFAVSPNGRYVAYIADQDTDNVFELYVAMADGSTVTKVSGTLVANGDVGQFTWAPDGSKVAYLADQDTDNVNEVFTVNPDGTSNTKVNGTLVAGGSVGLFSWAPDGSRLAYLADQETDNVYELYVVNANGTSNVKVNGTLIAGGDVDFNGGLWAPDSSRVAYLADQDTDNVNELYVVAPDGSGNVKVSGTLVAGGTVFQAIWAPNSARIAYVADQEADNRNELFSAAPDGSGSVKLNPALADLAAGGVGSFSWAPNGSRVAYVAVGQDTPSVLEAYTSLAAGGGNAKVNGTLVANGSVLGQPVWSPDSAHLVYVADQDTDGVNEVYVSRPDGSGNTKVSGAVPAGTNTFLGTGNQVWAPDSSLLIYVSDQTTLGVLDHFVSNLDGSVNVAITRSPGMFALAYYAQWSADGSRAIYPSAQDTPSQIELYMSTPDGVSNVKISGPLVAGGNVSQFDLQWSP